MSSARPGWRRWPKIPTLRQHPKRPNQLPMPAAENLINAPEFTVSELSSALKRTVEDAYGHVRVRGEISGFRGPHSSGHCYFALKDESAKIEAVIWKFAHARMRFKPQEGLEVIATGKLTTYPGSSKYQIVIEAIEPAGIGALMALMEERKRKLGGRRPVRRGAQAIAAVAAGGDRRRHLADRRGHPRHPAPAGGSFSPPRAGVAGEGAGRRLGRAGCGRHPRLQRAARGGKDSAAGSADRRARRRLAGGSVVVQRGDRGPRRRRQHDPADLGRRPRDRYHADRFRRRQARADADRRGRNGGARAQRIVRRGREPGAAHDGVLAARPGKPPQRIARRRPRAAGFKRTARDPTAAAGSSRRRPAPRTEGQYARPSPPLLASQPPG